AFGSLAYRNQFSELRLATHEACSITTAPLTFLEGTPAHSESLAGLVVVAVRPSMCNAVSVFYVRERHSTTPRATLLQTPNRRALYLCEISYKGLLAPTPRR